MKKTMLCLLAFCIFFVGCSQFNGPASNDSEKPESTTPEQTPYVEIDPDIPSYYDDYDDDYDHVLECEAPGYFSNLKDFYTFALTGSRDPAHYSDEYTSRNISWYPNVYPEALLRIEYLISDTSVLDDFDCVFINYFTNDYTYQFKHGLKISIEYDQIRYSTEKWVENYFDSKDAYYSFKNETETETFKTQVSNKVWYAKKVGSITVLRQKSDIYVELGHYQLWTCVDGFEIELSMCWPLAYSSLDEMMKDEKYQCITAFFDDSRLQDAVNSLELAVKKSKDK